MACAAGALQLLLPLVLAILVLTSAMGLSHNDLFEKILLLEWRAQPPRPPPGHLLDTSWAPPRHLLDTS